MINKRNETINLRIENFKRNYKKKINQIKWKIRRRKIQDYEFSKVAETLQKLKKKAKNVYD